MEGDGDEDDRRENPFSGVSTWDPYSHSLTSENLGRGTC